MKEVHKARKEFRGFYGALAHEISTQSLPNWLIGVGSRPGNDPVQIMETPSSLQRSVTHLLNKPCFSFTNQEHLPLAGTPHPGALDTKACEIRVLLVWRKLSGVGGGVQGKRSCPERGDRKGDMGGVCGQGVHREVGAWGQLTGQSLPGMSSTS